MSASFPQQQLSGHTTSAAVVAIVAIIDSDIPAANVQDRGDGITVNEPDSRAISNTNSNTSPESKAGCISKLPMSSRGNVEHESAFEDKKEHKNGIRSDFFVTVPVVSMSMTLVCLVGEVKSPEVKSLLLTNKTNGRSLE